MREGRIKFLLCFDCALNDTEALVSDEEESSEKHIKIGLTQNTEKFLTRSTKTYRNIYKSFSVE